MANRSHRFRPDRAGDGAVTSNTAIVPTANGSIDAYTSDQTQQLILDILS